MLSNRKAFHGTSRDIQGAILPNNVHRQGRANISTAESRPDLQFTPAGRDKLALDEHLRATRAYATESEGYAWKTFAHQTANLGGGRGRVYEVARQPDEAPGAFTSFFRENGQLLHGEITASHFPIKEQLDIKPGHQGTLPVDWRPFHLNAHQMLNGPAHLQQRATDLMRDMHQHGQQAFTKSGQVTDEAANHPPPEATQQRAATNRAEWRATGDEVRSRMAREQVEGQGALFTERGKVTKEAKPRKPRRQKSAQ